MTHEHVRLLLPSYAAGALITADADAVRAHLATGCPDCLEAFYRMPMGLPRDVRQVTADRSKNGGPDAGLPGDRIPAPAGPASGDGAPSWLAGAVGLLVIVALVACVLWFWLW